ncbi:hypothetical protein VN0009_13320 [Helicobacter pylori]
MVSKHSLSLMKFIIKLKRSLKTSFYKSKGMAKKSKIKKSQIKMGES